MYDYEPFYALTGYISENFDLKKEINFSKMFDGNEIEEKKRIEEEEKKIWKNLKDKKDDLKNVKKKRR